MWGGLHQSVMELDGGTELVRRDEGFACLAELEQCADKGQVASVICKITETERNRMNSPLLDMIFDRKVSKDTTMDHVEFVTSRGWMDPDDILAQACRDGPLDLLRGLLEKYPGRSMLGGVFMAACRGQAALVAIGLERGGRLERMDLALRFAAEAGHTKVVSLLLDHGANIHADNDAALVWSVNKGRKEVVELLLDRGANLHVQNDRPLRLAAEQGHKEVVELLLNRGANIHTNEDQPVSLALKNDHKDVVMLLLQRGALVQKPPVSPVSSPPQPIPPGLYIASKRRVQ